MQRSDTIIPILCFHSYVQCSSSSSRHLGVRVYLYLLRGVLFLSTVVVLLESALAKEQLLLCLRMKQIVMILHLE